MSASATSRTKPGRHSESTRERRDLALLGSTFSIDSRALAVVRISLAAIVLIEALVFEWSRPREASGLFDAVSQYGDILVVPFALMMLFGWKTRFAAVAVWLAYSLRVRADLLDPGLSVSIGDLILALALFWCMFLPLGRHLSVDSRGRSESPVRFLSVATGALLFQIFVIYFASGLWKSMDEWVFEATAMETILAHPNYETPLGLVLLDYPALLAAISVATIVLEVVGALLVILPGRTLAIRRMIIAPMFIALHIGIAVFMGLGLFPYVLMAVWLVFMPPAFWDWIWSAFRSKRVKPELLVDRGRLRNSLAGVALGIVVISNVISWLYFPEVDGLADDFQIVATHLVLYQQWAMFSVPSSLG